MTDPRRRDALRLTAVAAVLGAAAAARAQPGQQRPRAEDVASIGVAQMRDDGTIVLYLRATGPGGTLGTALLEYPPAHPQYYEVLRHLGGLKPGEVKNVPPWPE
jgi:hypothetical protein